MMKELNVLIVDDHPMTVDGYINVLSEENFEGYQLNFTRAIDCEEAYKLITHPNNRFDLAYLDLSLPAYPEEKIFSGLDLGLVLRKTMPECILIILTMHSEATLVDRLVKEINPQGILCKSDIDIDEFVNAFRIIYNGQIYYSHKIEKSLKNKVWDNYNFDHYDRQIMLRLAEGISTKNIPSYVPLSLNVIEKRIAHAKEVLLYNNGNDDDLIAAIKKLGIF
jgi:DNA-binding NarL/FixJ family response regulator